MHRTFDYLFKLPQELIADRPLPERHGARMMVINRGKQTISHHQFRDLDQFLGSDDLLVLNDTKVVPARYFSDEGNIELMRLEEASPTKWRCMVRPGKKMKIGRTVLLGGCTGTVESIDENGHRLISWDRPPPPDLGQLALPHYMERDAEELDETRYQTTFAREEGAIAAPTAGLHFTPEILSKFSHTFLTLHVGIGTFRPVKAEVITDHEMHSENYSLSKESAKTLAENRSSSGRTIAVGTTVTRVLEHLSRTQDDYPSPANGATDIFLHPPQKLQAIDGLLTNFHLPGSTLIMLVSALTGRELTLEAYRQAVAERYRFYSYGDCMLIL